MFQRSSFLLALLLLASLSYGQDRAAIRGTITDASGGVVAGTHVTLTAPATGLHRETLSGTTGIYEFSSLPVGSYQVQIARDGFRPVTVSDVVLQFAEIRTVDAKLEIGSSSERVEVVAALEGLNRANAEVGEVVDTKQMQELPISGRNWAELSLLANGAVNYGDGSQRSVRFNGHSLDDGNVTLDGIDATGVQEQTMKSDTRLAVAIDGISEFRVTTGVYTAESGSAAGAQINVVSKTGTNDMHGSAFYAVRNDALDSRSPFDGATLPPFTLNQFGASLGGAIVKNKAFFFTNFEGLDQHLGHSFINFVPNAAFRASVLAKSPAMAPLVSPYPVGQLPVDDISDQVTLVKNDAIREDSGLARFDYRFTDKDSMYVRYNIDNAYADTPQDALGTRNVVPVIPQNIAVQYQKLISPTLINEAKFGWNHVNYHNWTYGTAPVSTSPSGFDGLSSNSLDTEVGTTLSFIQNVTKIAGRHTFKAGVDVRRVMLDNSGNTITTQSITYASNDDFINNVADSASYLQGEGIAQSRHTMYMGYAQDEFKVTPNLTFNLGLRYEFYSVVHEIHNHSAVVDITGCGGYCPPGTPYYSPNTTDFGPRVGLSWAPAFLHGKTTVRTGFGIYYGQNQNDDFSDAAESFVPRYSWTSSDTPNLSFPLDQFVNPKNALFSPKAIARDRKDGSYNNYDFMIQQDLGQGFIAQAGYLGSEGHHLFDKYTENLINPLTGTRPLAQFSSFGEKANTGNNNFNALQAQVHRRFKHGLMLQSNYMWSHGITDASLGAGESVSFQDMSCRACDRSSSSMDVRHYFTTNAVYELPFGKGKALARSGAAAAVLGGWELAGIASARTGLPVNITASRKANVMLDGNTSGQRPNYVLGQSIYAANQTINNWFNPAAFSTPAKYTWGNLGRYIGNGPGALEFDTSLQRKFRINEKFAFDLRATAYNVANHPIYSNPSGTSTSSSFGHITSIINDGATGSGAPRRIEFMLRTDF
ncbi:MAG: TonB-dependent receptor [Bryobacteraceae bacterium]|nr:TonB-dependent receptor [Bryobacteraceae bacterium]